MNDPFRQFTCAPMWIKIAMVAIIASVNVTSCTTKPDIDISKYPIVTTIDEVLDHYYIDLDTTGAYEKSSITKYIDGSLELEYTYDLLDSEKHDPLYYSITVEGERTVRDAKEVYNLGLGALKLVGNAFSQGTIKIDSLDLPGDETYYALRTYDGEPNGMFYSVRKGKVIYTLIVSGLYSMDHSILKDLVLPKIEDLENFKIVK